MVLMPGPSRISWQALRKYLKRSRLTMATTDEVLRITGYEPGAVSPFGLSTPVRMLIDQSLLSLEEISLGSGARGVAIILQSKDFLRALDQYELGSFT